jgi:uncharacterized protein
VKLRLKVVPGASRLGHEWMDDTFGLLKVKVTVPPEKGKANKAVVKYLAGLLGLKLQDVSISSGSKSQQKIVEIEGLSEIEIRSRLSS